MPSRKNLFLIMELVNQKQGERLPPRQALLAGAVSRFRPILMTRFAPALGAIPIALALTFRDPGHVRLPGEKECYLARA